WFGGSDRRGALSTLHDLEQRFGFNFHRVDTTPFILGDASGQRDEIAQLRAYRPQLAISLTNAGYALTCRLAGAKHNLFTDVLQVPLMMLWDHGLFQFPAIILSPLPQQPEDSSAGAISRVAETINHPLMHHFAIDSGQVAEMLRLGLLQTKNVAIMP